MAKQKKKNSKDLKALIIFVVVIGFVASFSACGGDMSPEFEFSSHGTNNDSANTDAESDTPTSDTNNESADSNNESIDSNNETTASSTEQSQTDTTPNHEAKPATDVTTSESTEADTSAAIENSEPLKEQFADNQFSMSVETADLSNEKLGWSFKRNKMHKPVVGYTSLKLSEYGAYYIQPTEEKVVYLTFDEGYENGFSGKILDTLKEKNVSATFFVTKPYIADNPDLVKRMKEEGHMVGNHSVSHKSFPSLTDDQIINELEDTAVAYEETTGYQMDSFFRPPMGEYSERVLYLTRKEGYRTIFWSMAYKDWVVDDQPGAEAALKHVMDNYHPGAIILLHAVSESNTEALGDIIDGLHTEGYRFGSLYELEE